MAWAVVSAPRAISIHALHEESDRIAITKRLNRGISIHALHEESDNILDMSKLTALVFQSTLSMRRATLGFHLNLHPERISIHALHEESDISPHRRRHGRHYFNPRSP